MKLAARPVGSARDLCVTRGSYTSSMTVRDELTRSRRAAPNERVLFRTHLCFTKKKKRKEKEERERGKKKV